MVRRKSFVFGNKVLPVMGCDSKQTTGEKSMLVFLISFFLRVPCWIQELSQR